MSQPSARPLPWRIVKRSNVLFETIELLVNGRLIVYCREVLLALRCSRLAFLSLARELVITNRHCYFLLTAARA